MAAHGRGKRASKSGKGRVVAALEKPSTRNDGARRQAKLQAVASDTPRVWFANAFSNWFVGRVLFPVSWWSEESYMASYCGASVAIAERLCAFSLLFGISVFHLILC